MSTSTGRNLAFALGLSAVVAMSGFLLNAAPPQAVGTWEVLGTTDPSSARSGAATATLEDDTTLIAGGRMLDGTVTDSVLIYDPTTNASTVVGHLASPRVNAAAARLDDGRVLIVGGEIADLLSADAEIFDPFTGTSDVVANMAVPRKRHAATRLADGKVLIVGGVTLENVTLATAEVFDPETGGILEVGSMATPRAGASATLLIDNRVLVAGGNDGTQDLASAELFYPATQEFFPVDTPLSQARAGHTAVLLPHNGAVLIAGGTVADAPVANAPVVTTDLFLPTMFPDPYTWSMGTFGPAEHLTHARTQAVSGPMGDDGYAFVAGGGAAEGEAYAFVTLKTDKDDYAPGQAALITGSGWEPGEDVRLVFQEDPAVHPDYTLTLRANGDGEIYYDDWAPEEHDLNVRFYLMATGVTSQHRAQITFTDARNWELPFAGTGTGSVTVSVNIGTIKVPIACGGTNVDVPGPVTVTSSCAGSNKISTSENGAVVTLQANANVGSTFAGWSALANGTPASGAGSCTGTNNPCGATFGGNGSVTVTFNSGSASATTTVASSLNPSTYGSNVTFTASVKVGVTAVTTGSVTFIEGGTCALPTTTHAGPVALDGSGQAVFSTATLTVPSHTITVCYGGAAGFNSSNGSVSQTVNKANAVVVVTPYTVTYDATPHTATVTSITGVNSETGATVGTVDVSNTAHTAAGTYASDSWSFTGTANYNDIAATTITDTINKANAVVVVAPYTVTYDAAPHTATVTSITGVAGQTGATVGTVDVSNTTHTDAGVYSTDSWSFTGAGNYNDIAATTIIDTINKANAVVVVAPYTVTYDAAPHTATVTSITGVAGQTGATVGTVDVSNTTHTDAGVYSTDSWSFTGAGNYNDIAATTITDTINKANAVVVVAPYTVTYDGAEHTATVTSITGVNSETGVTVGTVNLANTAHTNAGIYTTDSWSFTGTANYNDIAATTITDTINKANATVVVTPYTVTYDGLPHTATVTSITGVNSETGATVGTVDVSNTTHTAAGVYNTDTWSFIGTANYKDIAATTITDTIEKADATVVVTPYMVTYNGLPHTAAVTSITGVNGEVDGAVGTVDVSNTTHTNAGVYTTDSWSFTGTANYKDIAATTITDTIEKANATVVVTPYTATYNGLPHTAAVTSITGVNGEVDGAVGTVDVSNTTHTAAGLYNTDTWSFTGTANYKDIAATTITDTIEKANATVVVTPYTVTYNGLPHTAAVTSIAGVNGEVDGAVGTVDVSHTTHTNAGTYTGDYWTFTGAGNYKDIAATTITDTIEKANATVVVAPYESTYNGLPRTATVTSIAGVNGEVDGAVGTVDVSHTTHTDAGTYAADFWTFTGGTNYKDIGAQTITDIIHKADATVTVTPYNVTYNGLPRTAMATVTGVNGEVGATVGTVNLAGTTHTNAGTYAADFWTFTGTANYKDIGSTTITDIIHKADATVVVTPYTVTYDGASHTATATVTGANGEMGATVGTVNLTNTTHTDAGIYNTDFWTFTGTANYDNIAATTITDTINKATTTTTLSSSLNLTGVPPVTSVRVNLTATVANEIVGGPTPVGTVTFTDSIVGFPGTVTLGTANLVGGMATLSPVTLALGQHVVTATYNPSVAPANFSGSVSAANDAPEALITGPATGSINPINVPFNFIGTFTDGTTGTRSAAWSFDGTSSILGGVVGSSSPWSVTGSKAFSTPGVYSVVLTADDGLGGISIVDSNGGLKEMVIAYDANGGFVTGGGWINSPAGAYVADASLVGKANFGFVSKYKKGASIPEGETEFQFHAAGLNFKSTSYQWLVVQGTSKAQYKGVGTINGSGSYQFLVSVVDGSPDKIRVKITNGSAVVYDNLVGGGVDDAEPSTALGGGSIVIHTK